MPRISAGQDFGLQVAEPRRFGDRAAMHRDAFGTSRGLKRQGERMEAEGLQEEERADRLKTSALLSGATLDYQEALLDVSEQIGTGELPRADAEAAWRERSSEIVDRIGDMLPPSKAGEVKAALEVTSRQYGFKVRAAVKARADEETEAYVGETLANLARDRTRDRATATALARTVMEAAGVGPADVQRRLQTFREARASVDASEEIRLARGDTKQLDAVRKRIRSGEFKDLRPEVVGRFEDEVLARQQYLEHQAEARQNRARADVERRSLEAYGTALLQVETTGEVESETWLQLKDAHRASILNRQQAEKRQRAIEAEGRPVKTDWPLYLQLRDEAMENPKAFAEIDLKQYVDRIGGAQLEQLVDMKGKLVAQIKHPGQAPRDAVTLTQQMNATMAALRIRKPEQKGQFLSFVQSAVDDATQAKGKALTFDERQRIIDQAVLKGPDPDAWFFGEKRLFELTPEQRSRFQPEAATDAPATEIDQLNEALRAQGLPLSPANRLALYNRVMNGTAR